MAYLYAVKDDEFTSAGFSMSMLDTLTAAALEAIQEDGRLRALVYVAIPWGNEPPQPLCSLAAHLEVNSDGQSVAVVVDEHIPDDVVDTINVLVSATVAAMYGPSNQGYTSPPALGVAYVPGSDWVSEYEVVTAMSESQSNHRGWGSVYTPPTPGMPQRVPIDMFPLPYGLRLSNSVIPVGSLLAQTQGALE